MTNKIMNEIDRRAFVASLLSTAFATGVAAKIPGLREAVVGSPDFGAPIECALQSFEEVFHRLILQIMDDAVTAAIRPAINNHLNIELRPAPVIERSGRALPPPAVSSST